MNIKKAYVIGTNVSKSMSPKIFNYWFKKHKINLAEYGFIELKEDGFGKEIKKILKTKDLVGLNITIPYKEKIISYINNENLSINPGCPTIKETPINCITFRTKKDPNYSLLGKITTKNTDGDGFRESLYRYGAFKNSKKMCAIILGYGGASKAIIHSLNEDKNFNRIIVFNRTFNKIKNLNKKYGKKIESYNLKELYKHTKRAQLIVNTVPVNMLGKKNIHDIDKKCFGFDVVYNPWEGTGFLRNFKKEKRIQGIHMLICQAAPCFEEWFGIKPKTNDSILLDTLYKQIKNK